MFILCGRFKSGVLDPALLFRVYSGLHVQV